MGGCSLLFQKVVAKYPDHKICADLYFRMGDIFEHKIKNATRATEMYQAVVEKHPNSSWVKFAQQRLAALQQGS